VRVIHFFRAAAGVAAGLAAGALAHRLSAHPKLFFVTGLLWAAWLIASFFGWGAIADRILRARLEPGEKGAWGLAAFVTIGGVLELTGLGHRSVLFSVLGIGVFFLELPPGVRRSRRFDGGHTFATAIVGALFALALAASLHGTIWNGGEHRDFDFHDDYQSYLVFPQKMIQTGEMGRDPFDVRRLLALGGQTSLQGAVVCALPVRATHLMEQGIAPLLAAFLLAAWMRRRRVDSRLGLLVLALLAILPFGEIRTNTTSVMTTLVLLLALAVWLGRDIDERTSIRTSGLGTALLASALLSLKATVIPPLGLFLAGCFVLAFLREGDKKSIRGEAILTAGAMAVFLAPWMISMFRSSGTFFFPILGPGTYMTHWAKGLANSVADETIPWRDRWGMALELMRPMLPVGLLVFVARDRRLRQPAFLLGAIAILDCFLLAIAHDPHIPRSLIRYHFPFLVAGALALLVSAFEETDGETAGFRFETAAGIVAAAILIFQLREPIEANSKQMAENLIDAFHAREVAYAEARNEIDGLLDPIPKGARVLTRLRYPFLLDFRAHDVLVMGLPGMASPSPGIPLSSNPESLRKFLVDHGVRYLAYGGKRDDSRLLRLSEADVRERYGGSRARYELLDLHRRFHERAAGLSKTWAHLSDTREAWAIDFETRRVELSCEDLRLKTRDLPEHGWTGALTRFENLDLPVGGARALAVWTRGWHPDPRSLVPRIDLGDGPVTARWNGHGFVVPISPDRKKIDHVVVEVEPSNPARFGLAPAGPVLGIDLSGIGLLMDSGGLVSAGAAQRGQALGPEIDPALVESKSGFSADFWTDGKAKLDDISIRIGPQQRIVLVSMDPILPSSVPVEKLDPRLFVNGLELSRLAIRSDRLVYGLPYGLRQIGRIEIRSATFVPRSVMTSTDSRSLGLPVRRIRFAGPWEAPDVALPPRSSFSASHTLWPECVAGARGFDSDGWTNGDARLGNLGWIIPPGTNRLDLLFRSAEHPRGEKLADLGVRVEIDGTELVLAELDRDRLSYRLPEKKTRIDEIRIVSSTFRPGGADPRTLGVPLDAIALSETPAGR